jgi:hypothetical protein
VICNEPAPSRLILITLPPFHNSSDRINGHLCRPIKHAEHGTPEEQDAGKRSTITTCWNAPSVAGVATMTKRHSIEDPHHDEERFWDPGRSKNLVGKGAWRRAVGRF